MNNNKSDEFSEEQQELASVAKVLSHPARIAIIQLLANQKEIKTGDISEFMPLSRTSISQHLKELRKMGIIKGTIDGLKIHYCIDIEKIKYIKKMYAELFDSVINDFICDC